MNDAPGLLYIDLETGFVGDVEMPERNRFSERHYVELSPMPGDPTQTPHSVYSRVLKPIVMALHNGLPTQDELAFSAMTLGDSRDLYYHWPAENVVEVVTPERLKSFRNHRRLLNAYWGWRNFRRGIAVNKNDLALRVKSNLGRAKRKAATIAPAALTAPAPRRRTVGVGAPDPERFSFLKEEADGRLVAQGRGLYVRLDYWAKLKGGGSYGHTVYQVKALNKASTGGVQCIHSSNFQLLAEFGVHQIITPSIVTNADEFSLVEAGEAYEPLIASLIRYYKPAFVFERLVLGNAAAARACAALGVPYIAEFNGSELTMSKVFGGRDMNNAEKLQAIETESFRLADIISVVSDPVKDAVVAHGVSPEKVLVNPNAVDLDSYKPLSPEDRATLRASLGFSPDDVVLGFCGTFGGWHGIEVLADAMPAIAAARAQAKFLLIGDGGFKHLVTSAIDKAGIGDRVKDVGMVPQQEAARILAACDIFLSPHSKNMGDKPFFGSPTKLFEYMAYGAGIVCSDLVQLGEVMSPGVRLDAAAKAPAEARSVLVAPGSAEELARAAMLLIDDEGLRNLIGRNARTAAEKYYTWDGHVQALWRFALGRPPGGYHDDRWNR